MRFYVNSTLVEIQYSFLLIIAFSICFGIYDYLFVLLFSALHEAGHIISLYVFGGRADKISFAFYGIGLKHSYQLDFAKDVMFLLSGVLVNLIFVIFGIKVKINLCLMLINILPIYPLDGGRALKLVLNNALGIAIADFAFGIMSAIIIIFLICISAYQRNLSLFLIAIYIVIYSINNSFD